MKDYKLPEMEGRGLQRIIRQSKKSGAPEPVFNYLPDSVSVTLPKRLL
ncbi:MAG: hypothetical protein HQM10_24320 [Candidatus Riflebacteria bacterium]|nr:hypothetical protein [Candidatus Riflebacteria bacterium]